MRIRSPTAIVKVFKCLSVSITAGVGATSLYFLHKNNYEYGSIGLVRFTRAGITASRIILDYKLSLWGIERGSEAYKNAISAAHQRGADRLLALAQANGGVFIKVGQHIAALMYLIPDEYTSTLAVLHSQAPASNFDEIKKLFNKSTGKDLETEFVEFDSEPCGVASLAQVHKARLRSNGDVVAVKIQHPKVKSRSLVDIATMEIFVGVASYMFPEFRLAWLIDEIKRNLPMELDFLHEAHNADQVRRMFAHLSYLKIPTIYYDYCSDQVLTMEFCEGSQINNLGFYKKENVDPVDVCRKLGRLYSEMIFMKGYVHCDPHPGNVLVKKDGETGLIDIILLDHGLYSTLNDDFRIDYCKLWNALLKPDKNEIKQICEKMNVGELYNLFACMVTSRSWNSITTGINKVKSTSAEQREIQEFAVSLIPQISQVLDQMPRSMLLILKTNDLLRAIERSLGVSNRRETFLEMARCCAWACYEDSTKKTAFLWKKLTLTLRLTMTLLKISLATWYFTVQSWYIRETPSTQPIYS